MDGNFFTSNTTHSHHGQLFNLTHGKTPIQANKSPKSQHNNTKKNPIHISVRIQTHNKRAFKIGFGFSIANRVYGGWVGLFGFLFGFVVAGGLIWVFRCKSFILQVLPESTTQRRHKVHHNAIL
uniref:Transmembrane protein n=1 Tax=Fagus sylvatica TaxID=28930 RepID=A0A2N9FSV6_FAGSY